MTDIVYRLTASYNELRKEAAVTITRLRAKIETAEKETASWKGLAKQFGNEADALRAKIEQMEQQEPVAKVRIHQTGGNAGIAWSAQPLNDFDSLPPLRDGDKLYALPGARAQPAQPAPVWPPLPSCGGPLCSDSEHHPLCRYSAPEAKP